MQPLSSPWKQPPGDNSCTRSNSWGLQLLLAENDSRWRRHGDDTCLTLGRMCTCVLLPSSASIDLYFYMPFLVPATHFDIFLKIWLIFIFLTTHIRLHHSSFQHTHLIPFFCQPFHLSCHHLLFHALFMPAPTCSPCSLAPSAPPSRLRATFVPPTSKSFRGILKYWWLLSAKPPSVRSAGGPRLHRDRVWTLGIATVMQWQMELRWSEGTEKKKEGMCTCVHMREKFEPPAGIFTCISWIPSRWLKQAHEPHHNVDLYPSITEITVAHFLLWNDFVSPVKVTLPKMHIRISMVRTSDGRKIRGNGGWGMVSKEKQQERDWWLENNTSWAWVQW